MDYSKENRLSYTERARRIVDSLTLEERVSLMSGSMTFEEVRGAIKKKTREHYNHFPYPAGGIPEKGIPAVLFCDGPRGVVCGNGKSTCFPVSMLRGASFDTDLEEEIGEAMAEVCRRMYQSSLQSRMGKKPGNIRRRLLPSGRDGRRPCAGHTEKGRHCVCQAFCLQSNGKCPFQSKCGLHQENGARSVPSPLQEMY